MSGLTYYKKKRRWTLKQRGLNLLECLTPRISELLSIFEKLIKIECVSAALLDYHENIKLSNSTTVRPERPLRDDAGASLLTILI